jgi:uncharacterized membrane protein
MIRQLLSDYSENIAGVLVLISFVLAFTSMCCLAEYTHARSEMAFGMLVVGAALFFAYASILLGGLNLLLKLLKIDR